MKYILFIAMDLAVYPFLLLLFIAKSIFSKYNRHIKTAFLISPIIRTFVLST